LLVGSVTHEGTPSNNVLVENNIAPTVIQGTSAATFLNNIAQYQLDLTSATGTVSYLKKPGVYAGNNIIDPTVANGFVKYDTADMVYDLHLLPSSPANGIATANNAPSIDIDGQTRSGNLAAGAYASSYPTPAPVVATTTPVTAPKVTTTTTATTITTTTKTPTQTTATSTTTAKIVTTVATSTPAVVKSTTATSTMTSGTATSTTTTKTATSTTATSTKVAITADRSALLASIFTAYSEILSAVRQSIQL
jgi:hypothetical protein